MQWAFAVRIVNCDRLQAFFLCAKQDADSLLHADNRTERGNKGALRRPSDGQD
ncbi:hypothetical protein N040_05385 [Serratia marcescens EGD-HP20]|nr:hypothetical protein N040_05385 [Serratia marcescens EGD-HP20]